MQDRGRHSARRALRALLALIVFAFAARASAADARTLTFDFTAVADQTSHGLGVSPGQAFSGFYSFDSTVPNGALAPNAGIYTNAVTAFVVAGQTLPEPSIGGISIFPSSYGAEAFFDIGVDPQFTTGTVIGASLILISPTTVFSDFSLPLTPPDLTEFPPFDATVVFAITDLPSHDQVSISGRVTSLVLVSEPPTFLLTVAPLWLIWRSRRRQSPADRLPLRS